MSWPTIRPEHRPSSASISNGRFPAKWRMLEGVGSQMDVKREIALRVDKLPPEMQAEVLRFVASLPTQTLTGERGAGLRQFSGFLDRDSAEEMAQAIEEHCERVDAGEW